MVKQKTTADYEIEFTGWTNSELLSGYRDFLPHTARHNAIWRVMRARGIKSGRELELIANINYIGAELDRLRGE